jgi:hypothetical protein
VTFHQCCTDAVDSVIKQQQVSTFNFSGLCTSLYTFALRKLHAGYSLTLPQVVPNSCCHGTRPATQHDADLLVRCPSPVALSPPLSCATWWLLRPSQPVSTQTRDKRCIKSVSPLYTIFVCNSYICSASYTKTRVVVSSFPISCCYSGQAHFLLPMDTKLRQDCPLLATKVSALGLMEELKTTVQCMTGCVREWMVFFDYFKVLYDLVIFHNVV